MKAIENQSTFLIKSTKNSSFGTAFCIKEDKKGSYFLTCTHVVEDCGVDTLEIEQYQAKVVAIGSKDSIDLAVVFVEGLFDCSVLKLSNESVEINQEFTIDGFKPHKKGSYKLEQLNGSIKKISQIYSNAKSIDTYELNIGNGDSIERGYSGSAIVCSGFVVAVATDRNTNGKQAYAVPIGYLGEIWEDMPDGLFVDYQLLNPYKGLFHFTYKDRERYFSSYVWLSLLLLIGVLFFNMSNHDDGLVEIVKEEIEKKEIVIKEQKKEIEEKDEEHKTDKRIILAQLENFKKIKDKLKREHPEIFKQNPQLIEELNELFELKGIEGVINYLRVVDWDKYREKNILLKTNVVEDPELLSDTYFYDVWMESIKKTFFNEKNTTNISEENNKCLLVIASRRTLLEAQEYVNNEALEFDKNNTRILLSKSGWYSISLGFLYENNSSEIIKKFKEKELIPQDSICSKIKYYTEENITQEIILFDEENWILPSILTLDFLINGALYRDPNTLKYSKNYLTINEILYKDNPNHPSLAISYNNKGLIYKAKGDYFNALKYTKKALAIMEVLYKDNPNHPNLAINYSNISILYYAIGNHGNSSLITK